MRNFLLTTLILAMTSVTFASPEVPGAPQTHPIAITGATIHPVSGPAIEDGVIVFDEGRITAVGKSDLEIPEGAKVVEAKDHHVYPGLINTDGMLGLIEINAVRATDDTGEVGQLNMNIRAEVAVNPDSELIPVTRSGGVLMNLTSPRRGLIMGTSALLQLDGWTTEDLTLLAPAGMHIRWPSLREADHHEEEKEAEDHSKERDEQLQQIEAVFANANAYRAAREHDPDQPVDLRQEAMLGLLKGEVPIIVTADRASQIRSAIAFASRHKLKLIIYGGNDADQCAELLKSSDVPVILSGIYRLPLRRHEAYDHTFTLPERLRQAGVKFCISGVRPLRGQQHPQSSLSRRDGHRVWLA